MRLVSSQGNFHFRIKAGVHKSRAPDRRGNYMFYCDNTIGETSVWNLCKGKAVPLQAWTGPEGSRKLRFLDFVTTTQDGGRLSALGTGRLYPQEILVVLISVRG